MSGSLEKRSASPEATESLGAAFAPTLRAGDVVALRGPLGAGKTRFVAGLARGLSPGAHVRSPSFTLVNEYPGSPSLFHLDLYRLDSARETEGLGLEEYADQGALAVEWGERLPAAWLAEAIMIVVTPLGGDARMFAGSAFAGRGRELLEAWRALAEKW